MKTKLLLFLSCFAAVTLTTSAVSAAPRGGHGGGHFASMPARGGHTFTRSDNRFNNRFNNRVIFIGDFGFPWWWGWGPSWGWGWGASWGYPYGYYGGYGSGDPGYGYGNYGYGNGYGYGYGSDSQYGSSSQYGSPTRSRVAELQRRLARAGYYRGSIDGVLGPQTRRAIRAYSQDHGYADAG